jgi:5'-methylthioadenosine phosphorylase
MIRGERVKRATVGIIGGSGLYDIEGIRVVDEMKMKTPWGAPSDSIVIADMDETRVAFLPRHGRGHVHLPHEINYRANIAALKMLGVQEILAFSAVGSLKEDIRPMDFVLPLQVIDRTRSRVSTFFGEGIAAHVSMADPFCPRLQGAVPSAAGRLGVRIHAGETLVCMEGPAFSTRAESHLYRSWGAGVINMSAVPEAKLAREAEICYCLICMSTDYDCWKEDEAHVTVEMVINNLNRNAANARSLIKDLIPRMSHDRTCGCGEAVKYAVITAKEKRCKKKAKMLHAILPDYF